MSPIPPIPPMPPMPPPPGPPAGIGLSFFGFSATIASVVIKRPATEAASCSAVRTTLAGSITPRLTRSPYSLAWASKPQLASSLSSSLPTTTAPSTPAFSAICRAGHWIAFERAIIAADDDVDRAPDAVPAQHLGAAEALVVLQVRGGD